MILLFRKYYPLKNIIFFLGEGWLICLSILLAGWIINGNEVMLAELADNCLQAAIVTLVFQLNLYFFDLYDLRQDKAVADTLTRMVQACGMGCIMVGVLYYLMPSIILSQQVFWSGYVFLCLAVLVWRLLYYTVLHKRLFLQEVVIIGTGKLASEIAEEIEGRHDSVYRVAAFIGDTPPGYNPRNAPIHKHLEDIPSEVLENEIERVIIALDERRGALPLNTLLKYKLRGLVIEHGVSFYERITGRILVNRVDPSAFIFSARIGLSRWRYLLQRFRDVLFSIILSILSLPVMLLTALAIKLESPGPVLYFQERVGLYGGVFQLVKFRSMRLDAEKDGAVWAHEDDDRVTRCGSFIRKTRIDELPQLWNVLRGEMSLVGPRPERPVFVSKLIETIPFYGLRHDVKPGLTGWAQISFPYGASVEDSVRKLEYDLYYVKNVSMALDFLVIFHTIKTVLFQKGSR